MVLYSLSDKQKGIQSDHANNEYQLRFGKSKEYLQWSNKDKTIIMLDGGTSNQVGFEYYSKEPYEGTLDIALKQLLAMKIPVRPFFEPDFNNTMTAIAFLVDERAWDKKKYPDPPGYMKLGVNMRTAYDSALLVKTYGKQIAFLREFLPKFKLA